MDSKYIQLSNIEREKIHEDIERIRQVLQTDVDDLYLDDDEDDALHADERDPNDELNKNANRPYNTSFSENTLQGALGDITKAHQESYGSAINTSFSTDLDLTRHYIDQVNLGDEEGRDELEYPANAAVALALNRAYQEVIAENLKRIKLVLVHNRERQSHLEHEIQNKGMSTGQYSNDLHKRKSLSVYQMPYFKDINGMHPPLNEDGMMKRRNEEADPFIKPPKTLTRDQLTKLRSAVGADTKHKLMTPLINKKEIILEKISELTKDQVDERLKFDDTIYKLDVKIEELKHLSVIELLTRRGPNEAHIDWLKIANIDFDGQRSADELEMTWRHFAHPKINTGKFRAPEDNSLVTIATKYGFRDWDGIANELDTNRTGFQCLQRYQMKLNPVLKTGKWTQEEDEILIEVLEQCRLPNGDIDWTNVSYFMEGRSYDMCQQRWNVIDPALAHKKGRWTEAEDMKMLTALQIYGTQWSKLDKFVPSRTGMQIRERFYNAYNNYKQGDWTYEEDRYIWLNVIENGGQWASIAKHLQGRSDSNISSRYKRLYKWGELSSSLGNYNPENLDVLLKAKVSHMRTQMAKVNTVSKAVHKNRKKSAASDGFLDKTLMFKEALQKGKVSQEELMKNQEFSQKVNEELKKFHSEQQELILIKPNKTYAEREQERILNSKIEEDIRQGIFIPRPPPGVEMTRTYSSLLSKKISIQSMIKDKIMKSVMKSGHLNDIPVVNKTVENMLQGEETQNLGAMDQLKLKSIGKMLTVKEILHLTSSLKTNAFDSHGIELNDSVEHKPMSLDDEIGSFLYQNDTYRPGYLKKKFPGKEQLEKSEEMKTRVSRLMFAALNIDVKGSVASADAIRSGTHPKSWSSRKAYDFNSSAIESNINKLSAVSMTPIRVTALPEPINNLQFLTPSTQGEASADMSQNSFSIKTEPNSQTKPRVPRLKALTGDDSVMYRIPPLPPSYSSLIAFKELLLKRKKLIKNAGRFHIPGSLTTGKPNPESGLSGHTYLRKVRNNSVKSSHLNDRNNRSQIDQASSVPIGHSTPVVSKNRNLNETQDVHIGESYMPESRSNLESVVVPVFSHIQDLNSEDLNITAQTATHEYKAKDLLTAKKIIQTQNIARLEEGNLSFDKFTRIAEGETIQRSNSPEPVFAGFKQKLRAVEKLRKTHDYHLLNGRFRSVFLWPALLSTIPVSKMKQTIKKREKKKRNYGMKPKRKHKKRKPSSLPSTMLETVSDVEGDENFDNDKTDAPMIKTEHLEHNNETADKSESEEHNPASCGAKKRGRPKGGGQKMYQELSKVPRVSERKRIIKDHEKEYDDKEDEIHGKIAKRNTSLVKAYLGNYQRTKQWRKPKSEKLKKQESCVNGQIIKGEPEWSNESDNTAIYSSTNNGNEDNRLQVSSSQPSQSWNIINEPQIPISCMTDNATHTRHLNQEQSRNFGQNANCVENVTVNCTLKPSSINTDSVKENVDMSQLVPCILVGDQLIPVNHPLLSDFISSIKALSKQDSTNVKNIEIDRDNELADTLLDPE